MTFKVYESMECRESKLEERVKFMQSVEKLQKIGLKVEIVSVSSADGLEEGSEARELVEFDGMNCLPITEYDGTVVDSGNYPADQILADYLDVPNGVLSADKTSVPAANDREFCCCECRKG